MTTISAAVPAVQLPPPSSAGPASQPVPAKAAAATPSDTVSISVAGSALSENSSGTPAERRVDSLIEEVKSHNDVADARAHVDWANTVKYVGQAKADAFKAAFDTYLRNSTARIGIDLNGSGISVQPDTTTKAPEGDAVPSLLSVNSFSFKADGSTYAVTSGKNGTLMGTKDGQAWKTWQILPSHAGKVNGGAQAALSTLQGLLSPSKPGSLSLVQVTA